MTLKLTRHGFLSGAAALAAAAGLSSCGAGGVGSSASGSVPSGLKMRAWDFQPDTVSQLVKTWSDASGVPVDVEINALSGYAQALQTRMQSGDAIDVFYNQASNGKKYFEANWAAALNDLDGADKVVEDIFPSALPAYQSAQGDLIALPYYSALHYTIYNTAYLEQAGISAPPTSLDDLYSQCEKLKASGVCETPYQGFWAKDGTAEWFINYLLNGGVTPFHDDGSPAFADDSNAVHVLEWWLEMFTSGLAPQSTLTDDPGVLTSNLADGKTAFFSAHHYFLQMVRDAAGPQSGNVLGMSSGFGTAKTLQAGEILQMGVIDDTDRRAKAWDLMKFYGYKDDEGRLPAFEQWAVAAGQLAPYPAFFEDRTIREAMSKTYDLEALKTTFENESDPVPTRFEIWYPDFAAEVSPIIEDMLISSKDPKKALDSLAKAAQTAKDNA